MYLTILWVLLWTKDTTFKCICICALPLVFLFPVAFIWTTEGEEFRKMEEMREQNEHEKITFSLRNYISVSIRTTRPRKLITLMSDWYFLYTIFCTYIVLYFILLFFFFHVYVSFTFSSVSFISVFTSPYLFAQQYK